MTRRELAAVCVALAVLAAIAGWQRRPRELPPSGPQAIVAAGAVDVERVRRVTVDREGRDGEALELHHDGAGWIVASRERAPADPDHVDRLLDTLAGLAGEVRAADEALLPEFQLAGDGATRVELFDEADASALALWVGKRGPRANRSFVRPDGDDRAWLAHAGVHGALGIHGHGDRPFDPDFFLRLRLLPIEPDAVTSMRATGEARWAVSRDGSDGAWRWDDRPAEVAGVPPDERQCTGRAHSLQRARAAGLVGRGGLAERGLAPPDTTLAVTAEGVEHTLLIGSPVPAEADADRPRDERFVAVAGDDLVWRMSASAIDALLRPPG